MPLLEGIFQTRGYSRILSRSSSWPPCKKRRPGTNCRTLIWKSDTGERKWAIGASLLPGGRQAFEGSPGSFSLASDRRSIVRQRESSLLLHGRRPFCIRSRETDFPRFHPVEAPPFSFPFHARAKFSLTSPFVPPGFSAIPATVPSPNSFRSPSARSDASNWKTSNQKHLPSNTSSFVLVSTRSNEQKGEYICVYIYVCISKEERDSLQKCGEDSFLSTVREMIINSRTLHPFVPWLIAKIISGGCAFFDLYLYLSLSLPRCTCCILPNGTSSSLTRSFHGRESVHGFVGNVVLRNLFDRRTRCVFARSRRLLLRPRMLPVKD